MTGGSLAGKVVAIIGHGDDLHRAIAVAAAEAGADVALATTERSQSEGYGANSIANEIWAIGREHFVSETDESNAGEMEAFASDVWDRLGGCALIVTARCAAPDVALGAFAGRMESKGGACLVVINGERPRPAAAQKAFGGASVQVIEETDPSETAKAVLELLL